MKSRFVCYFFVVAFIALALQTFATLRWNVLNPYRDFVLSNMATADAVTAASKVRNYDSTLFYQNRTQEISKQSSWPNDPFWKRSGCNNWGSVTTTSSAATSAIRTFATLDGWCLVVVADGEGPQSFEIQNAKGSVVFLSRAKQEELANHIPFVKKSLWNHASRKNIAYLYAIANGAKFIWEFDENIELVGTETLTRYTNASTAQLLVAETRKRKQCSVFNPLPFFRPSDTSPIPRGLPLDKLEVPGCKLAPRFYIHDVPAKHVGILQFIADQIPDRDQISRLLRPNSITFEGSYGDHPVVVPPSTMSPMNSQATLYSQVAMWSLFLPTTVQTAVADTWRSYVAQTLAKECNMLVAFAGPHVRRDPSSQQLLANVSAELKWQENLGRLVSYLSNDWSYHDHEPTLQGALERLYVDLYEIGGIEWEDVEMAQLWISALQSIGYEFPAFQSSPNSARLVETENKKWKWTGAPFEDVVLVGQFNYNTGASIVTQWTRRWREVFKHIDVRGPFDNVTMDSLRQAGINPFQTAGEEGGLYSPMKTMGESLRLYTNNPAIRGVIVVHDDLLFNVSRLVELGFPSDDGVIGKFLPHVMAKPYLYMYNNGTLRVGNSSDLFPATDFKNHLYDWYWWEEIIPRVTQAALNDSDSVKYAEVDGGIPFYRHAQSDFVYVPTWDAEMIEQYASYADFMFRIEIMLEVGTPTILGRMMDRFNITVSCVELCTNWEKNRGDLMGWMPSCINNWTSWEYGLYHPIKAKTLGLEKWNALFDTIVLGRGLSPSSEPVAHNQPRRKKKKGTTG